MTAVRWVVEHRPDQIGGPDWVEYPDEPTARQHAGTAATVWALIDAAELAHLKAEQHSRYGWAALLDERDAALEEARRDLDTFRSYRAVVEAAVAWRAEHARWERENPYHGASGADVLALIAAVDAVTRPADPIAAIADAHPLSFVSRSPLLCASCGCGWRGDFTSSEQLAFADHAAHVHVAAGLATEEDA